MHGVFSGPALAAIAMLPSCFQVGAGRSFEGMRGVATNVSDYMLTETIQAFPSSVLDTVPLPICLCNKQRVAAEFGRTRRRRQDLIRHELPSIRHRGDCRSTPKAAAASYLQRRGQLHPVPSYVSEPQTPVTFVVQQISPREVPHGLELVVGMVIGVLLSVVAIAFGFWPLAVRQQEPVDKQHVDGTAVEPGPEVAMPEVAMPELSRGQLHLPYICYNETYFRQFSWSFERERDCVLVVDASSREVARTAGRFMAMPNGEMYAESQGSTWAVLKRLAPSRRPGQLWDFKVCGSDGVPYVEVRQMSETKCVVDCGTSQRKLMTVVGNFTYPVFLSGERNIHVWFQQGAQYAKPGLCAQVEAHSHISGGATSSSAAEPPKESRSEEFRAHRFHVTTTAGIDASLVLVVLLGLQDVHRAAVRQVEAMPALEDDSCKVAGP